MEKTAFWSHFGRCAVLGVAGSAALMLGGCSSGTQRFDSAFSLGRGNTQTANMQAAQADPTVTGSIPVPPEPVYAQDRSYNGANYATGSTGTGSYQTASYGRSNAYDGTAYSGSNNYRATSYNTASSSSGSYNTGSYGTRRNLPPPSGYNSGSGAYSPRPTPVSYQPSAPTRYGTQASAYPPKQAVYTPPGWHATPVPGSRPARTRVAMADKAELTGPGSKTITVQPGDSLYLYASRYHVSVDALKTANGMTGMELRAGQKIIIPASGSTVHDDSYIVQPGDNLNAIAYKNNVTPKALAAANHISDPRSLQVGQELTIPGGHSTSAPKPVVAHSQVPEPAPASNGGNTVHVVKTTHIAAPKPAAAPQQSASNSDDEGQIASNTTLPRPAPMSGQRFRWPVQGRIVSKFGTRADGGHNDGIDIAVPQGTEVRAAENGVVAYAGDELKGYGNLVLIRHANNWVTAYAHNENLLVKRGDKVTRGEVIAKAGATGSVSQPELHFELRKGSRPVDPLEYMTTSTASAD